MRYLIKTSGKGMLGKGKIVGHIEADDEEDADKKLIASSQVSPYFKRFFDFESQR